jgi:uncharacterized OB-fold protein
LTRRDPTKVEIGWEVYRAVEEGRLVKPTACERCGRSSANLQAHHEDYSRPLDVEWLCETCHKRHHKEEKDAMNEQTAREMGVI